MMTTKHQASRLEIYAAWKQTNKQKVLKDFLLFVVIPKILYGFKD